LNKLEKRVNKSEHRRGEKVADDYGKSEKSRESNSRHSDRDDWKSLLAQLVLEAILQFGADLGNLHARADQELAAQEFVRAVFVCEFADDATILAVLVPAESPVRNRFRADVLKAAENRVFFRNLESFPQDFDFDEPLVRAKNLRSPARRGSFRHWWSRLL
jgi:hypothetical protein